MSLSSARGLTLIRTAVLLAAPTACFLYWGRAAVGAGAAGAASGRQLASFTLHEQFGVSHPMQIVDFDLARAVDPKLAVLIGPDGSEAPFQVLEGGKKLALETDLPAGADRTWKLLERKAPVRATVSVPEGVRIAETAAYYEIVNGITGVRIPKPTVANPGFRPQVDLFNQGRDAPRVFLPAPVQGVLLRDGTWTGLGPNGLVVLANVLKDMEVTFLEKGPLVTKVEVAYRVDHPAYQYASMHIADAGPGYYRSVITLEAGQPSIVFAEDTDLEMTWSMDLYAGLHPDHARYRGHHATRKEYGYEPDGQVYGTGSSRRPMDAQVDLQYERPQVASYMSGPYAWRWMQAWDPWTFDTGWYWQLFDSRAPENSNLIGFFAGRTSQAIGVAASGVSLLTLPQRPGQSVPTAGITVSSNRRSASNTVARRSRFEWGLYVATRHELKPPVEVQPINQQMNLHGGFNLSKIHRWDTDFPDPPGGYGGLYMDRKAVESIRERLRQDRGGPNSRNYYGYLYTADPSSRPLVDMWADPTGAKLQLAADAVTRTAHALLNTLVNGGGIHTPQFGYWQGGLEMMRHGIWIDQILGDPRTTDVERRQIKAAASLFGNVLWDNDFVPMDNPHGLNFGTANMPVQQMGYRHFYALLLANHPTMMERARQAEADARATVKHLINDQGAEMGCPHYIAASFAPTLETLMQLKQLGREDPFRAEPRLARFAEFYLNLMTPPEPRVGGKRAFISLGDSSTEPSEIYGMLGTAFRDANPKLSARLMGAWQENGKPHSGFFGTTYLMIDDRLPAADPALGDASFQGYFSVLRHGWGTPDETALWLVDGDQYSDHRHSDQGSVVIYALGQPLSVDWSSIYTPQAPGCYMHSGLVPENRLGFPWDRDSPPLNSRQPWSRSTQEAFQTFPEGAYARAHFTSQDPAQPGVWTRAVTSVHVDPAHPILVLRDSLTGEGTNAARVVNLNLMASGPVSTPAGMIQPPLRTHPAAEHNAANPAHQLPSATPPFPLAAGVNRLGFTGRYGIDFDVYTVSDQPQQALLGNWAVSAWGGHMTDREERQHILRVHGAGTLTTVIVPWRKGQAPAGLKVTREGDAVLVRTTGFTARIGPEGYTVTRGKAIVTRSFENAGK